MRPETLAKPSRRLAENQDEYNTLDIMDVEVEPGLNVMLSFWRPTPEELDLINQGKPIRLGILGTVHPPVMLDVIG